MSKKPTIAESNPELIAEWHQTKNVNLTPENVSAGSGKKVWWLCGKGHEWDATVSSRSNRTKGSNCPYCSGSKCIKGENDLGTTHPELSKQWHPTKNGDLKPEDVSAGSNKRVWWQCEKGHEWDAVINNRSKRKNCPYCGKDKIIKSRE